MLRPGHKFIVIARDRQDRLGALGFDREQDARAHFERLSKQDQYELVLLTVLEESTKPLAILRKTWVSGRKKKD